MFRAIFYKIIFQIKEMIAYPFLFPQNIKFRFLPLRSHSASFLFGHIPLPSPPPVTELVEVCGKSLKGAGV